jgi:hypothetical protein
MSTKHRAAISIFSSPLPVSLAAAFILIVLGGGLLPRLFDSDPATALAGQIAGTLFQWFGMYVALGAVGFHLFCSKAENVARSRPLTVLQPASDNRIITSLLEDRPRRPAPAAWSIELLQALEWKRFEALVIGYFEAKGFTTEVVPLGNGESRDILLTKCADGQPVVVVHCWGWNARPVAVRYVREMLGAMAHRNVSRGLLIAKAGFAQEALDLGRTHGVRLISGSMLFAGIQALPVSVWEHLLHVAATDDFRTPTCPTCEVKMVRRQNERREFWGCRNSPRCRTRLPLESSSYSRLQTTDAQEFALG